MDFTRDEAQDAVAEVVVSLMERESARDMRLWPRLVDSGLLAVPIPQSHGGDGMGLLGASVLLTELAMDAAAVPALPTLGFGVLPLAASAPESVLAAVLPEVGKGAVLTAALNEPAAPFTSKPETTAITTGETTRVSGCKVAVPYAEQARWVVVPTNSGLALVDSDADGLVMTPTPASGGIPEYTVSLEQVEIPADRIWPTGLADLHHLALASIGSVADGLLEGAIVHTAEHLRTRHQFGRPLAQFQAVAQQIADLYIASRALHVAAVSATWALAHDDASPQHRERTDDDLEILAYLVADELPAAMQKCHHLHGGLGVDITHPMHRYYSQAKDIARWLGGASLRLDRLGARCSST
ncbi:acyl-CoA dehydrogenase family protein [Nocardia sp. CNY236]|uniref:acyl-CoA dehydrogenase family protein n=1 Tax=Nocardia sp. CNY236 TaxID=1169152 RepID=UPI00041EB0E3|nr:acyl-CoA dehydrogenase family protein [Nocardia sp. CNY236]